MRLYLQIIKKKMKKNIKRISINLEEVEVTRSEFLMKLFEISSIQNLIRNLILEGYKKEKNKQLLYGHATEKRVTIADKLNSFLAMDDETLTNHVRSLGYELFTDARLSDPNDMSVDRDWIYDKIKTFPGGERDWVQYHYKDSSPNKKPYYDRPVNWGLEKLFKELLKLKLIK